MLTYLLFRFFLTVPVTGAVTGADVAAPAVAQVEKQPAAVKPVVPETKPTTATSDAVDPRGEAVESPRVAQVRLAEMLGTAEAIHSVRARGNQITFTITRGADTIELIATTKRGEVTALSIVPVAPSNELGGGLSWLSEEVEGVTAITKLVPDEDGAVTLTTDDGRRYMLIPGRGSGGSSGNEAPASRFAGEFDHT